MRKKPPNDLQAQALKELYHDAFPLDSAAYTDVFFAQKMHTYALYENGAPVSAAYGIFKDAVLFGKRQKLAYISAVGTLTAHRGKAKAATVMSAALLDLAKKGFVYAALNPFDYDYYRRYDFFDACYTQEVPLKGTLPFLVRRIALTDAAVLAKIEQASSKGYDGYLRASVARIRKKIAEYAADGIVGNLLSDPDTGRPFAFFFAEGGAVTFYAAAPKDMSRLLESRAASGNTIRLFSTVGEPTIQLRVLQAFEALRNFDYGAEPDFSGVLRLVDGIIESNNGYIGICIQKGRLKKLVRLSKSQVLPDEPMFTLTPVQLGDWLVNGFFGAIHPKRFRFVDKF